MESEGGSGGGSGDGGGGVGGWVGGEWALKNDIVLYATTL